MDDRNKIATTTGGAIGFSAFASFVSLCCIGSWAVTLLGVSGAVALARWQPYRIYVLGIAAVLLGWAFWRVYRQPCTERWLKTMLWGTTALIILAFFADELQWLLIDPAPER